MEKADLVTSGVWTNCHISSNSITSSEWVDGNAMVHGVSSPNRDVEICRGNIRNEMSDCGVSHAALTP